MRLSLDAVEREIARLWHEEARRSQAPRMELSTLVALVSDPSLLERARRAVDEVALAHPSRTVVAVWTGGAPPSVTAEVSLHRAASGDAAWADAIVLEAIGQGREWLPEAIERLALVDLPVCVWWVGDLPDRDDLFDRVAVEADLVVVNSGDMDLRDLDTLSRVVARSHDRYALADLTWIRLRSVQELVARFFDDEASRAAMGRLRRATIEFAPGHDGTDVASTQAGLLFGWIAGALSLPVEAARWTRGQGWAEAELGGFVARFEARARTDVPPGSILVVSLSDGAERFDLRRQADPQVFRWSSELPDAPDTAQTLRVTTHAESTLLARCVERPGRDHLLETSLRLASQAFRPVAPRLSIPPPEL